MRARNPLLTSRAMDFISAWRGWRSVVDGIGLKPLCIIRHAGSAAFFRATSCWCTANGRAAFPVRRRHGIADETALSAASGRRRQQAAAAGMDGIDK